MSVVIDSTYRTRHYWRDGNGVPIAVTENNQVLKGNGTTPTSFSALTLSLPTDAWQKACFVPYTTTNVAIFIIEGSGKSVNLNVYFMDTNGDTISSATTILTTDNKSSYAGAIVGACRDGNGNFHVAYVDGQSNMGTDYRTVLYVNNIGGWSTSGIEILGASAQVHASENVIVNNLIVNTNNLVELLVREQTSTGTLVGHHACLANALDATSFTLHEVLTSSETPSSEYPHLVVASNGDTHVISKSITSGTIIHKYHDSANGWTTWGTVTKQYSSAPLTLGGLSSVIGIGTDMWIAFNSTTSRPCWVTAECSATPTYPSTHESDNSETDTSEVYGTNKSRWNNYGSDGTNHGIADTRPEFDMVLWDSVATESKLYTVSVGASEVNGTSSETTSTSQSSQIEGTGFLNTFDPKPKTTTSAQIIAEIYFANTKSDCSTTTSAQITGLQEVTGTSSVTTGTSQSSQIEGEIEESSSVSTSTATASQIEGEGQLSSSISTATATQAVIGSEVTGTSSASTSTSQSSQIEGDVQGASTATTSTSQSSAIQAEGQLSSTVSTQTTIASDLVGELNEQSTVTTSTSVSAQIQGELTATSSVSTSTTQSSSITASGEANGTSTVSTATSQSSTIIGEGVMASTEATSTSQSSSIIGELYGQSLINASTSVSSSIIGEMYGQSSVDTSTTTSSDLEGEGQLQTTVSTQTTTSAQIGQDTSDVTGTSSVNTSTTVSSQLVGEGELNTSVSTFTSQSSQIQGEVADVQGTSSVNTQTVTSSQLVGFIDGQSTILTGTVVLVEIEGEGDLSTSISTQTITFANIFDGSYDVNEIDSQESSVMTSHTKQAGLKLTDTRNSGVKNADSKSSSGRLSENQNSVVILTQTKKSNLL